MCNTNSGGVSRLMFWKKQPPLYSYRCPRASLYSEDGPISFIDRGMFTAQLIIRGSFKRLRGVPQHTFLLDFKLSDVLRAPDWPENWLTWKWRHPRCATWIVSYTFSERAPFLPQPPTEKNCQYRGEVWPRHCMQNKVFLVANTEQCRYGMHPQMGTSVNAKFIQTFWPL